MPRYFFDADDGRQSCTDSQGLDLRDDREARVEAIALVQTLVSDDRHLDGGSRYHVCVRRDGNVPVYRVDFALTESWAVTPETADLPSSR